MISAGKKYHFVGIGGAGMSGLAAVMLAGGVRVSGSDLQENKEAEEKIARVVIKENSKLAGLEIKESELATATGEYIISIKRGKKRIYNPDKETKLKEGDILLVRGTEEGEKLLKKICNGEINEWRN